ncbi:MAG TPA: LacI family DNA-binding transcriptional regulator, partial [Terriglobales bacterium]|nr:LacI family DNA-binding transcriptional regulator [Terriglobales bacterium]
MRKRSTIIDIAKALGVSVSTVHRALKGDPSTTAATRNRVLQMANKLEYKPNLAARFLSSKQAIRISVNTPKGTTSFWDEVRTGIAEEKDSLDLENLHVEYRTYSRWGEDEFTALEQALHDGVNGVIAFPSDPAKLEPLMRHAERQ